jgi:pimeloyl-ACP methyl ester carboxylesterase
MKQKIIFLLVVVSLHITRAQELARRPLLGIQMLKVDEDTRRVMHLPDLKGVLIKSVIPNSTAVKAGFETGDVLLKLNDQEINSPEEGIKFVAASASGESFSYELIRDHKIIKGTSVFEAMPLEKHEGMEMVYTSISTVNGLQRLIISKPNDAQKHPAIIFIGGIGCYSLDFPMEPERSEVQLLNALTREGYVCIRAEKPGVGDNMKCTPCAEVSFNNEISSYISAAQAVKKYAYVDSSSVYIIGHSMGGVMAPVIAQQTRIKGIIAYGTIGSGFIEYLAKTRRTLAEAYKMSPEDTDDYIKDYCECAGYYFVEGLTTEEAAKKKAACKDYLSVFDYRSRAYNKELYALNIPGAWKDFSGKALLLWGENDFISSKEDHQVIANTVNYYHKGNADFILVKSASHGMNVANSYEEALSKNAAGAKYNPEVGTTISKWLKSIG